MMILAKKDRVRLASAHHLYEVALGLCLLSSAYVHDWPRHSVRLPRVWQGRDLFVPEGRLSQPQKVLRHS